MPENNLNIPQRLLLFDGVCNLCNRSVQFVIHHDPAGKFKFAALQSPYAEKVLKDFPEVSWANRPEQHNWRSIIFILNGRCYTKSSAILKVMSLMKFPWKFAVVFYIIPRPLRDALYNFIAKRRYHWFGKKDSCMVPTPELQARFMDSD